MFMEQLEGFFKFFLFWFFFFSSLAPVHVFWGVFCLFFFFVCLFLFFILLWNAMFNVTVWLSELLKCDTCPCLNAAEQYNFKQKSYFTAEVWWFLNRCLCVWPATNLGDVYYLYMYIQIYSIHIYAHRHVLIYVWNL